MSLIEAELEDEGYTIVDRTRNGMTYTWEVEDSRGFDEPIASPMTSSVLLTTGSSPAMWAASTAWSTSSH